MLSTFIVAVKLRGWTLLPKLYDFPTTIISNLPYQALHKYSYFILDSGQYTPLLHDETQHTCRFRCLGWKPRGTPTCTDLDPNKSYIMPPAPRSRRLPRVLRNTERSRKLPRRHALQAKVGLALSGDIMQPPFTGYVVSNTLLLTTLMHWPAGNRMKEGSDSYTGGTPSHDNIAEPGGHATWSSSSSSFTLASEKGRDSSVGLIVPYLTDRML